MIRSIYSYEHPDYGQMVKDVPELLRPLLDVGDNHDKEVLSFDKIMAECSKMQRSTLAARLPSL